MSIGVRQMSDGSRRYDVRLRRPDGTVYNKTFRTRRDAESYQRSERSARDQGRWIDPRTGTVTFSDYATAWVKDRTVRGRPIAPRTAETYRYLLRRFLLPTFGEIGVAKITAQSVRTWYGTITRDGPSSVGAKSYRLLHAILASAADEAIIVANPCRIKGGGNERTDERPIVSVTDIAKLADSIEERWKAMVLLAAYGSLRFGELVGLRRRDIDIRQHIVVIDQQLVELADGRQLRTAPKSEAGRRRVTLPRFVTDELEDHLKRFVDPKPDALVFVGERGGVPTRRNWARTWDRAKRSAGLPDSIHLHDLRHAGATMAAQTGATTRELMARLGHGSPRAALIYQHASAERDRSIAEGLDRIGRAMRPSDPDSADQTASGDAGGGTAHARWTRDGQGDEVPAIDEEATRNGS